MNEIKRAEYSVAGQEPLKSLFEMGKYLHKTTVEQNIQEFIKIRISQLNGCAFCLDMHWKDARAMGETEQRLYGLSAWQESPYYNDRERAALLWAEAVNACHVSDNVYQETSKHFSDNELVALTMAVNNINSWNRLNIAFSKEKVGTYVVGQY